MTDIGSLCHATLVRWRVDDTCITVWSDHACRCG
jgi:hypothetical protein